MRGFINRLVLKSKPEKQINEFLCVLRGSSEAGGEIILKKKDYWFYIDEYAKPY